MPEARGSPPGPPRADGPDAAAPPGAAAAEGPGRTEARARVHVSVRRAGTPEPPPLVRPEYAAGWLALTADPAPLLGLPPTPPEPRDLLARRAAAFAPVQEHYYADPPRIERGWRHHLVGTDGRVYLDMVNNVAVLGHAHPRVEAAAARQMRRLNTNSRFHYAAVVELSERLAALLPEPLDTVFLVNSGSEAVDLALRLAMAATGRRDVVAISEAYHGWTYLTDAVSTSVADNPNALTTRPDWVHTVPAPHRTPGPATAGAGHRRTASEPPPTGHDHQMGARSGQNWPELRPPGDQAVGAATPGPAPAHLADTADASQTPGALRGEGAVCEDVGTPPAGRERAAAGQEVGGAVVAGAAAGAPAPGVGRVAPAAGAGGVTAHAGAEAAAAAVAVIDELAAQGHPPAAFVAEAFFGNAGGIPLPDGYLAAVYAAVRRHGGLAVADEVQAGYGRLGRWFWGFEQQGVVPDVVAVAKAMGNGHPLGAVVTSREVAQRYRAGGYFFSSTGGSPVSCVIGTTVLEVLEEEGLQGNAARVGAHLKARLAALDHPIIVAVHGEGLYLGVELARDGEPATEDTARICDRLRELGVIMQPTGDHLNVLKIKPPLCLDAEGADFFVDALDRVLTEGW